LSATPSEALVSQWIHSFNVRDLDGMLDCMSPGIRFYPLRLSGLERYYRGHDGIRNWFHRLLEWDHRHRIAVHKVRAEPDGAVIAIGELHLDEDADPARFWARDQIQDGQIVVCHHYLTDPDTLDEIQAPRRPGRPPRFPGL
jgi:ketosteroid isomerase-like protein